MEPTKKADQVKTGDVCLSTTGVTGRVLDLDTKVPVPFAIVEWANGHVGRAVLTLLRKKSTRNFRISPAHPPYYYARVWIRPEDVDAKTEKMLNSTCMWGGSDKNDPILGRSWEFRVSLPTTLNFLQEQGFVEVKW